MRMCLLSKNKLKFVDGSIPIPSKDDAIFSIWERCNTMVLSWIQRSLSPSIAQSIMWIDSALEVWKDLFDRFSQGNALRISDLQEEIYVFKQGTLSVTDFFTQLKILWDEYSNLRMVPVCTCNPQCNCEALKTVRNQHEGDYVIRFLKGLNENYATVRTQNIELVVFAAQGNVSYQGRNSFNNNRSFINRPPINSANNGFNNNSFNNNGARTQGQRRFFTNNNDKPVCSHCGFSGHTVDICFKKHGYPPGYKPRVRTQSFVNQVGDSIIGNEQELYYNDQGCDNNGYYEEIMSENERIGRSFNNNQVLSESKENVPVFTQQQYQQLMSMLQ
ncbi:uncharacterized protein LOC126680689 [Mercurialis annua]|uniref:uncharacterized protein LOC126680689 n=1 Tax=Mercurialis annua TaxID=3986 RepID=UPI00215DD71F|nr:uncharacterized protein LOC126680689 [Mercurialis annua]